MAWGVQLLDISQCTFWKKLFPFLDLVAGNTLDKSFSTFSQEIHSGGCILCESHCFLNPNNCLYNPCNSVLVQNVSSKAGQCPLVSKNFEKLPGILSHVQRRMAGAGRHLRGSPSTTHFYFRNKPICVIPKNNKPPQDSSPLTPINTRMNMALRHCWCVLLCLAPAFPTTFLLDFRYFHSNRVLRLQFWKEVHAGLLS